MRTIETILNESDERWTRGMASLGLRILGCFDERLRTAAEGSAPDPEAALRGVIRAYREAMAANDSGRATVAVFTFELMARCARYNEARALERN